MTRQETRQTNKFYSSWPLFSSFNQCLHLSKDTIVYSAHTKNEVESELCHSFSIMQVSNEYFFSKLLKSFSVLYADILR